MSSSRATTQVVKMMENLRASKPVPCPAIQFSGGEPTIYPQFVEVIKKAKELGFAQIQVATNGIKFAEDLEFLKASAEAGLNTIYLQFDGLNDEIYMMARGQEAAGHQAEGHRERPEAGAPAPRSCSCPPS